MGLQAGGVRGDRGDREREVVRSPGGSGSAGGVRVDDHVPGDRFCGNANVMAGAPGGIWDKNRRPRGSLNNCWTPGCPLPGAQAGRRGYRDRRREGLRDKYRAWEGEEELFLAPATRTTNAAGVAAGGAAGGAAGTGTGYRRSRRGIAGHDHDPTAGTPGTAGDEFNRRVALRGAGRRTGGAAQVPGPGRRTCSSPSRGARGTSSRTSERYTDVVTNAYTTAAGRAGRRTQTSATHDGVYGDALPPCRRA